MKVLVLLLVCLPMVFSKHVSERDLNGLERLLKALSDVERKSPEKIASSQLTEDARNEPAAIVADKGAEDRNSQADVMEEKTAQEERNVKKVKNDERNVEITHEESQSQYRDDADIRIIGGNEIDDISNWPYLVSIQNDYGGSCTASLIAARWVLTAAHCVEGKLSDPSVWTARLGDEDFSNGFFEAIASFFGGGPAEEEDVVKIIIHPGYVSSAQAAYKNDIALMKLESAAPLDDEDIGLVTLPSQGDYYFPQDGAMCIAKGWGCTRGGGDRVSVARILEIPKISDAECSSTFQMDEMRTRLCAGYNLKGMGLCKGDSGGPLVSLNSAGHYVQVGVASFVTSTTGDLPGFFTRVSHYIDWIQQTMANN